MSLKFSSIGLLGITRLNAAQAKQTDSTEYKMLLDPKQFQNPSEARSLLVDQLTQAGDQCDVNFQPATEEEKRTQEITFLDTKDHALRGQGYVLRHREVQGRPKKSNLTLKFRSENLEQVRDSKVETGEGVAAKSKVEEDRTYQGVERTVYSKSSKVKSPKYDTQLESLTATFPSLQDVELNGATTLHKVNKQDLLEQRYLLGNVEIQEGSQVPAYLTLWYEDKDPVVAEVSYAMDSNLAKQGTPESLMQSLKRQSPDWIVSDGSTTKTGFIYDS